jgi:hypothetical protein
MTAYKISTSGGKLAVFFDVDSSTAIPLRQLIWNVRTRKEVSSWGAASLPFGGYQQKELYGKDPKNVSKGTTDFVLSLSPAGKYFAEGDSGSISLYAIQP